MFANAGAGSEGLIARAYHHAEIRLDNRSVPEILSSLLRRPVDREDRLRGTHLITAPDRRLRCRAPRATLLRRRHGGEPSTIA